MTISKLVILMIRFCLDFVLLIIKKHFFFIKFFYIAWLNVKNKIPRLVRRCRSSADDIYPLPSLSKWRNPSLKSSAVLDDRFFEIA